MVALEVKVEQSLGMRVVWRSDLPGRVEWSSGSKVEWSSEQWKQEMGCPLTSSELRAERSSNLGVEQSLGMRAEQSSNLEAEWSLEQLKCKMGCPLTDPWLIPRSIPYRSSDFIPTTL